MGINRSVVLEPGCPPIPGTLSSVDTLSGLGYGFELHIEGECCVAGHLHTDL